MWPEITHPQAAAQGEGAAAALPADVKAMLVRVSAIVFLTTAVSSIVFQSTTFALPKVFDERLGGTRACRPTAAADRLAFLVFRAGLDGPAGRRAFPRPARAAHRCS